VSPRRCPGSLSSSSRARAAFPHIDPDPSPTGSSGKLRVDWALRVDTLTAVMLVVVTTVSSLVHLYSIGYMDDDPNRPRFFAYLSLFTFAMLMLVTADNLVQMFFGWEGVGLASYLLIGFWYRSRRPTPRRSRPSSSTASAISASRSASSLVFSCSGSTDFDDHLRRAPASPARPSISSAGTPTR
jgi:NADH-quinone oxidoreductase subunit L